MHPVEHTLLWQRMTRVLEVGSYARTLDAMRAAYERRDQEIRDLIAREPRIGYDVYLPHRHWNTPELTLANAFGWHGIAGFTYTDWDSLNTLMRVRRV